MTRHFRIWHIASFAALQHHGRCWGVERPQPGHRGINVNDPKRSWSFKQHTCASLWQDVLVHAEQVAGINFALDRLETRVGRFTEGISHDAERLIGSMRREVLGHVVVLGERHLRHLLLSYMTYYNEARTHLSLDKEAPIPRQVQGVGRIYGGVAS
jgi:hypothetical protein